MKLTTIKKLATAFVCSCIIFTSCKNEEELIKTITPPSASEFKSFRQSTLNDITQTKTFKAEDGTEFTSAKGAIVKIYPNCLQSQAGTPITGEVNLSFIEMYDRGNMVLTNKPLMGKDENGNKLPLVTAGQYNIKVTQGANELKSGCYFIVRVPARLTGPLDNQMSLWRGIIDANDDLTWESDALAAELLGTGSDDNTNGNTNWEEYYEIHWYENFGWTNLDRFYHNSSPKTDINIKVPEGYNKNNSAIYVSFEDQPNLISQFYNQDPNSKIFSIGNCIPIGINAHIIFISTFNNSVVYAVKDVKVTANANLTFSKEELKTSSKAEVTALINNLK